MFDSHTFNWVLKTQAAILTDRNAPAPGFAPEAIEALLNREPLSPSNPAVKSGALGFLLPAVDGDFAWLFVLDSDLFANILNTLAGECARAGLKWEIVSEDIFRKTPWCGDRV